MTLAVNVPYIAVCFISYYLLARFRLLENSDTNLERKYAGQCRCTGLLVLRWLPFLNISYLDNNAGSVIIASKVNKYR